MRMPARQGLAVLHALADGWRMGRQLLAAVGVEDEAGADGLIKVSALTGRAERILASGGEVVRG